MNAKAFINLLKKDLLNFRNVFITVLWLILVIQIQAMKSLFVLFLSFLSLSVFAQDKSKAVKSDKQLVEAGCGICKLGMKGDDCELAVRINGKSYLVEGTSIDEHGNAHAEDGFCNYVRKAEVKGEVVDNKFRASYFRLIPLTEKEKAKLQKEKEKEKKKNKA